MKRTWMMASSERAWKVRLTSVKHGLKGRPARRIGTQPFTPFGAVWRLAAALWRRLIAPLGLPSSTSCASRWYRCRPVRHLLCWSHRLSPQPSDGSAPTRVIAEPARLSTLSALHSASGLPSLCAGGECMQAAPASGAPRSRRTSLPLLPLSPLCPFTSPSFALDFAGILSVNGKRQSARRGWYVWTNG